MSNDINNNIKIIGAQKRNNNPVQKTFLQQNQTDEAEKNAQSSLNFLGTLGCAQVNMDNLRHERIKTALKELKADPILVQTHVETCDSLVQRGYPLEEAIKITDRIFKTLSDKNTYI